jgi:iron-sulfur cluster repair protein YtfE (RIC family)
MTKTNSIPNLMIAHHHLLEALLKILQENLEKNTKEVMRTLDKFQWEFQKHLFSEEAVLFKISKEGNFSVKELVEELEDDHTEMLGILRGLKESLIKDEKINLSELQEIIEEHAQREERELYPILEEKLSKEEKEMVISQIEEIPLQK